MEQRSQLNEMKPLCLAELPRSYDVATRVLELARPICDDPEYRDRFYEQMQTVRTPLTEADSVNGSPVYTKNEFLQASGAYKQRGANNAMLMMPADTVEVSTYSTGNHGQAVVKAGILKGVRVALELPETMSSAKRRPLEQAAREQDGQLTLNFHPDFQTAQTIAQLRRSAPGVEVIDPFGHWNVLAGQCSVGQEMVEQIMALGLENEDVMIPVSAAGGGHLLGIALPIWEAKQAGRLGHNVNVVAVQPENTDALGRAVAKIKAGQDPVDLFAPGELDKDCDALAITEESLSSLTLAVAADTDFVSKFVTIDKLSLAYARQYTSSQVGVQVEPAAALPMAYAQQNADGSQVFILPVTGKNISSETQALYDGLVAENNYLLYQEACRNYSEQTEESKGVAAQLAGELALRSVRDWRMYDSETGQSPAFFEPRATNALGGYTAAYRQGLVTPTQRR